MSGTGKFRLMVSYDAGWHYKPERSADSLDELRESMNILDAEGWRWYVEDPSGEQVLDVECKIHAGILDSLERLRGAK